MKCLKCKKECMESELIEGFCYDCIEKAKQNNDSSKIHIDIENETAEKIKTLNDIYKWGGIILTVLATIIFAFSTEEFLNSIIIGVISIIIIYITSLLLESLSTIIQLLEDIKNK